MRFDKFRLDVANQCLWRGDTRVSLMPKPFAVLQYLVEHPGRLVTHDQLLGAIWPDTYVQPEVLRRYILEIRRALGDRAEAPQFVRTFPKRGYQFIAAVTEDSPLPLRESALPAAKHLVGRSAPLAGLDRCLTQALEGRRQVVFVVGEPGIGDVTIYLVRGSMRQRLGMVTGLGTAEFTFPWRWLSQSGTSRLMAYPIAGARAQLSEPLIVQPGQWIKWTLEADLTRSSMAVY